MATLGPQESLARVTRAEKRLRSTTRRVFPALPEALGRDSFHCSPQGRGSAVQFNSSVSAMPAAASRTFPAPASKGTADTLPVRWA